MPCAREAHPILLQKNSRQLDGTEKPQFQKLKRKDYQLMQDAINKLSVKESAGIGKVTEETIRSWIKEGKVKAEKIKNVFFIDPDSLEAHLTQAKKAKAAAKTRTEPSEGAPPIGHSEQPNGNSAPSSGKFPIPPDALAAIETVVIPPKQPQPNPPSQPRSEPDKPLLDLKSGPSSVGSGASTGQKHQPRGDRKPPASVAAGQSAQRNEADKRWQGKEAPREAGRRYKKSPVQFAKKVMRHLDMAQMLDVRDWLLRRMDAKMKFA